MIAAPSFALAEPTFPLRALAIATSKAPLGGVREALLATLVGARLAAGARGPAALPPPLRAERALAARHWLGALTLAAPVRTAILQLLDASVLGQPAALASALANVTAVTAPHLDAKARSELDRLSRSLDT